MAAAAQVTVLHHPLGHLGAAVDLHTGNILALHEQDQLAHGHIKGHLVVAGLQLGTAEDPVAHLRQLGQHLSGVRCLLVILPVGVGDLRRLAGTGADAQVHHIDVAAELIQLGHDLVPVLVNIIVKNTVRENDQILLIAIGSA